MPVSFLSRRFQRCLGRVVITSMFLAVSLAKAQAASESASISAIPASPEFRPDQILVQLKVRGNSEALTKLHAGHGSKVLRRFERLGGLQVVSVPPGDTAPGLAAKYRASGLVQFAEPDYIRHTALAPNDPKYVDGTLWALNNYGQSGGTPHADIDAPAAWETLTSASNIIVAVLDSGVRYTHEDLAANMWTHPVDRSHGTNALAGTNDPADDQGHGTLMAGVLGAVGNNTKGVVGVAWQVQIMACKCFDNNGNGSDSAIIACIEYARVNGARIINASFDNTAYSQSLSNAIYSAREDGILFVASCGNSAADVNANPRYPAGYAIDNVVSVAYTTRNDTLGRLSNYGATKVHLAAPGAAIHSTFFTSDSAYLGGQFLEGTSYAAAYVSGALALMLERYPTETHQQIIQRLLDATDRLPALAGKCTTAGRLNLNKALNPPIQLTVLPAENRGEVRLRVSGPSGRTYVVEAASDLANWQPVFTNAASAAGTFNFSDSFATNFSYRFYRAVSVP